MGFPPAPRGLFFSLFWSISLPLSRRFCPYGFFQLWLVLGFPVRDGLLIALGGPFHRFLHGVAHLTHQVATMIGMIAHPKLSFERHCQSPAIPDLSSKSIGWRSFRQHCWDVSLLLCCQPGRRSFRRIRLEGLFPSLSPAFHPLA